MRRVSCALAVVLLLGACGDSGDADDAGSRATTTVTTSPTENLGGVNAIIRGTSIAVDGLAVELDDNYFQPTIIAGTSRQTLSLQLANEGKVSHNFSLTEQGLDTVVPAGSTAVVKVTMSASGDLVFFCKFHKDEAGMVGALRVT